MGSRIFPWNGSACCGILRIVSTILKFTLPALLLSILLAACAKSTPVSATPNSPYVSTKIVIHDIQLHGSVQGTLQSTEGNCPVNTQYPVQFMGSINGIHYAANVYLHEKELVLYGDVLTREPQPSVVPTVIAAPQQLWSSNTSQGILVNGRSVRFNNVVLLPSSTNTQAGRSDVILSGSITCMP